MRSIALFGCAWAGLATSPALQAQTRSDTPLIAIAESPDATARDEIAAEVVVTALKRSDSLQNTPATVQVVSREQIQNSGINTIAQLGNVVPGVVIQRPPNNTANATIRGLGTSPGPVAFEQGVALFVDGVYAARGADFLSSLFDVERVEVVKGAQVAVLGKNTSFGAILLTTRKPGHDFAVDALANYEFERDSTVLSGGVDIPLGDRLAVRIAGQYQDLGGFMRNRLDNGMAEREARQTNEAAGRITATWEPATGTSVTLSYSHEFLRNDGVPAELVQGSPAALALFAAAGHADLYETDLDYQYASDGAFGGPSRLRQTSDRATATIGLDLGVGALTSVTGWSRFDQERFMDYDYTPGSYVNDQTRVRGEQISQELRLTSTRSSAFQYLVGGLYIHNTLVQDLTQYVTYPVNPRGAFNGRFDQRSDTWSLFAQPSFDLTDTLTLIGGARVTGERKVLLDERRTIVPGVYTTVLYPPFPLTRLTRDETAVDGSVTVRYKPASGVMLYASWGQGTKGGGFSDFATPANAAYEPEVARTIEAGFKLRGAAGHWSLNGAYFHTRVADFQNNLFNGVSFVVENLRVAVDGAELSTDWSPLPALRLFLDGTYANARNLDRAANMDNRMPRAPRLTGRVGATYAPELTDRLALTLGADVTYRSRISHQIDPMSVPFGEAFPQVNGTVGIRDRRSGVEVSLIGRNLNDAKSTSFGFPFPSAPGAAAAFPEEPRTVALQVKIVR